MAKITVITICYNSEVNIENTIQSVINQDYDDVEYIIVDGGSKDKTLSIVEKYRDRIDFLISENDHGIYDAMNKGISVSNGDWLIFMNSGDRFCNCSVIRRLFSGNKYEGIDVITGKVRYDDGRVFIGKNGWKIIFFNTLHHQGTFYRKKVICNGYNIKWLILADYDLNLKLYNNKSKIKMVNCYIADCEPDGVSQKIIKTKYMEEIEIKKQYYSGVTYVAVCLVVYAKYIIKKILNMVKEYVND